MKRQIRDTKAQPAPAPVRVAILLPERPWAGSVLLVRDLLQAAGTLAARNSDLAASALFDVRLLARSRAPVVSFGGLPLTPELTLKRTGDFSVWLCPRSSRRQPKRPKTTRRTANGCAGNMQVAHW